MSRVLQVWLAMLFIASACGATYSSLTIPQGGAIQIASPENLVLLMQGDGNLVLYEGTTWLWNSGTAGQNCGANQCSAVFTLDGNLTVYNGSTALWSTNTGGNSGARLVLTDKTPQIEIVAANQSVLWANVYTFSAGNLVLPQNASVNLSSAVLVMQGDGNLVMYQGSTPVWASNTGGQNCGAGQCHAVFQSDGNFVVYNGATPLWTSNTGGNPWAELALTPSPNYVRVVGEVSTDPGTAGLTSFTLSDGPHLIYVDGNRHLIQTWYSTSDQLWRHEDLTATVGGPSAAAGTQLTAFMLSDGPHIMFIDANQQVEQIWYTLAAPAWHIQNLTDWPGRVPAAGKALNTFMGPDGAHTFYTGTNGHLDQIWWTGSEWLWQDLSLNGAAPDAGTGIASYTLDNALPEIIFLDTNEHVQEWRGGVPEQDLTATAGGLPGTSGSAIATWMQSNGPHLVYVGSNQHIWQLWYTTSSGTWSVQDLTASCGAAPPEAGTPLSVFAGPDGDHLYFIAANQHLSQLWWTGTRWLFQDLWVNVASQDLPSGTTGLTTYTLDSVTPYVIFLGADGDLEQAWLQGSNGMVQLDLTLLMNLNFTISGEVSSLGAGLPDVTVTLNGSNLNGNVSGTTTTDANGNYSFSAQYDGTYTVTPSLSGYSFNPGSQTFYDFQSNQTANFSGTIPGGPGTQPGASREFIRLNGQVVAIENGH